MNIDWVVAVGIFIGFVAWSFTYYMGMFNDIPSVSAELEGINNKIMDFLTVSVYTLPVSYESGSEGTGILYIDNAWPGGTKESVMVTSDGESLPCMFSGERLYWETGLSAGENEFEVLYADLDVGMRCDSSLETSGANQTIPGVAEESSMVSESLFIEMGMMSYPHFSLMLGIDRDFRVEWESGGSSYAYGESTPRNINVFVKESVSPVMEDSEPAKIRVLSW